jgi:arsenate reductase (glutaredoxin)
MTEYSDEFVIYHNPRCSKSRAALELLQQRGIEPTIIEYLKTPPTQDELRDVIKKLGIKPEALLRKGEEVFKEKFAGHDLSDDQCIAAMVENPVLIERPIVIRGGCAVIGRPSERVNELLRNFLKLM